MLLHRPIMIYDFSLCIDQKVIWKGRRFCLIDMRLNSEPCLDFDYEFYDGLVGGVVAYIKENSATEFDCYLSAPNTDKLVFSSLREVCVEIPKFVNSYLRSKK